jgi:ribonuclease BN (tRNA processing enzyme)
VHYRLRVNGLDNAYIREFGCDCARCARRSRAANTSVSLFAEDENGQLLSHVLFDAGSGVMDSLLEYPPLRAAPRLDAVVLTHWHPDHSAELTRICNTWSRSRRRHGESAPKVPVWCRTGSAAWLERLYPHLHLLGLELHGFGGSEPMGALLSGFGLELPGVKITPLSLSHSTADLNPERPTEALPCCAGYILEFAQHKIGLLWDLDASNLWLEDASHEAVRRLRGADHLFFDSNTWAYSTTPDGRPASHASFGLIGRFARVLEPKQTWLVHLSGHEDRPGDGFGWEDTRWELEAKRVWAAQGLPGGVRVPALGETISLTAEANMPAAKLEETREAVQ